MSYLIKNCRTRVEKLRCIQQPVKQNNKKISFTIAIKIFFKILKIKLPNNYKNDMKQKKI